MLKSIMALLGASGLLLQTGAAMACTWIMPPEAAWALDADLVVEGRLVEYRPNAFDSFPRSPQYAHITLDVTAALAGEARGRVELMLPLHYAPVPEEWRWGDTVIVGAFIPPYPDRQIDHPRKDLPTIITPTCAEAFIMPSSEALRSEIEVLLAEADHRMPAGY